MNENRSAFSPLDWENGKNDGSFVRLRLARSAEIVQQRWQTKTEIIPPLLFLGAESWLCDWNDGDFESGKFSIDDAGGMENYQLTLKFLSRTQPIDFQTWFTATLKKQQVCVELTDGNGNERVFNPFDVSYKFDQNSQNGEMTAYEIVFTRSKLIEQKDRILSVQTDCESGITKFVFASGKPELYDILYSIDEMEISDVFGANVGFLDLADGEYFGYAVLKGKTLDDSSVILTTKFVVKCHAGVLEILEIEEILDYTLEILEIEEITTLAENQGILITGINA